MNLLQSKALKFIISTYLGWLVGVYFIAYLGLSTLPTQDFFRKQLFYPNANMDFWSRWSNWDGGGFRYIAESSYTPFLTVFFPLYPLLIKAAVSLGINSLIAGILISLISGFLALFFLYKLVSFEFNEEIAKKTILVFLAFPASFYLSTVYSDGLALVISLASLYLARKERWKLAALFSSLALITRPVGIGTTAAILILYLLKKDYKPKFDFLWMTFLNRIGSLIILFYILLNGLITFSAFADPLISGIITTISQLLYWPLIVAISFFLFNAIRLLLKNLNLKKIISLNFLFISLAPISLLSYLYYQQMKFGSMFTFLELEASVWGRHLSLPWDGAIHALKLVLFQPLQIGELPAHLHFRIIILVFSLILLVISYLKLPFYLTAYSFVTFIIPLLSGSLGDLMRFTLVNFPLFISLALFKDHVAIKYYFFLSILFSAFFIILFINQYFFI